MSFSNAFKNDINLNDIEFDNYKYNSNYSTIYGYKEDYDNKSIFFVQRVVPRKTGTYTRHYTIFFGDFTPQKQKQYAYTTRINFEYMSDREAIKLINEMFDDRIYVKGNHLFNKLIQ